MKKDWRPSWKELVNIKNKIGKTNILLLQIYTLIQIHQLGNETHVVFNTKNIIKVNWNTSRFQTTFFSQELLGSVFENKLTNCGSW